jgi:hypothetical protein
MTMQGIGRRSLLKAGLWRVHREILESASLSKHRFPTVLLLALLSTSSLSATPPPSAGTSPMTRSDSPGTTFGDDVAFLRKYTDVVVLSDETQRAQVVIAPAWQGRVMTSTAEGDAGRSFGWINREHIASRELVPHINVFGGEERFWLGPEGGQFSIFHAKGGEFDWANWQVPEALDTRPFLGVIHTRDRASFRAEFSLRNYAGTNFQVRVNRDVRLLDNGSAWRYLGLAPLNQIHLVAYESRNTLTNVGQEPWRKETGLLSIWMPGMFPPSLGTTIVVPIRAGSNSQLGPEVTSDYFAPVPPDRLKVTSNAIFFRGDGAFQGKIGISPGRSLAKFGAYDPQHRVLTIIQFNQLEGVSDYVKSLWKIQAQPYAGDAINAYNDGPAKPGAKPFGPFYELESSSSAAALAPGALMEHTRRTFHLTGPQNDLNSVAVAVLGLSLRDINAALTAR